MMEQFGTLNVAIVGGGSGCKAIMDMIFAEKLRQPRMKLIGVASRNPKAVRYLYAQEKGIYTTTDYRDLYKLKDLHMIIELTGSDQLEDEISRTKPPRVKLMDHVAARVFWDVFNIEEQRIAECRRAEEALRESEQEKQAILDSMSEDVVFHDTEHRIIWANRVASESVGSTPDELVGRHCYEVFHQRIKPCPGCPFLKARDTGEPQAAEMTSPDGRIWFVRGYPVRDAHDDIAGVVEVTLEITQRKRAEDALRESEERYRTVLEACPDPVVVYDMEGNGIYINPAFTRVFGWTSEELLGKKINYVPDENWPETRAMIEKVLAGESFSGVESRRYTKQGKILDVSISVATYLDRDGIPVGSVHTLRDITDRKLVEAALQKAHDELEQRVEERTAELARTTEQLKLELTERKRAEEALRESEEKYRTISATAQDAIVMMDNRGNISYWNPAAERIFGYTTVEAIGNELHTFLGPQRYHEAYKEGFKKFQETGQGVAVGKTLELSAIRKDGREIPIELSVSGIQIKGKWHATGIIRDITYRKQAEEELRLAHRDLAIKADELEAANEELSQYASVVSHNLKAPLRAIRNYADFLREDLEATLGGGQKTYLDGLERAVRQGQQLVEDLLEFGRVGRASEPTERIVNNHGGKVWVESEKGKGASFYFSLPKVS